MEKELVLKIRRDAGLLAGPWRTSREDRCSSGTQKSKSKRGDASSQSPRWRVPQPNPCVETTAATFLKGCNILNERFPTFLAPGTGFVEHNFSTDRGLGGRWGRWFKRWGAADGASLARLPLTSCCAAHFLTGHGLVPVRGLGIGDPCSKSQRLGSDTNFHLTSYEGWSGNRKEEASHNASKVSM